MTKRERERESIDRRVRWIYEWWWTSGITTTRRRRTRGVVEEKEKVVVEEEEEGRERERKRESKDRQTNRLGAPSAILLPVGRGGGGVDVDGVDSAVTTNRSTPRAVLSRSIGCTYVDSRGRKGRVLVQR